MALTVFNVGVAIFGLPNTMFMHGIRRLTGIFRLSHIGARVKTHFMPLVTPSQERPLHQDRAKKKSVD